jgi:hypothetical protein
MPDNTGRKQAGRWKKGESGNPAGRPRGARSRATVAVEELLEGEVEALTRKAVELALGGDTTALRLCLERLAPPVRERPLELELPPIESAKDLPRAVASLLQAVATGTVTAGEAEKLGRLVGQYVQAVEVAEIEERLRTLEEAAEKKEKRSR